MSRFSLHKLSIILLCFLVFGCATYNVQYHADYQNSATDKTFDTKEIDHTFYLIGDGGNATFEEDLSHFDLLKKELKNASKKKYLTIFRRQHL